MNVFFLVLSTNISIGVLIASLVGELVLVAIVLFLVKSYRSGGCAYHQSVNSSNSSSVKPDEETMLCDTSSFKRQHNDSVSGTIINHYDVNQNGSNH